jgi:hypothetical protein
MAIIHQATLTPTKAELVAAWLPAQPWSDGAEGDVHPVAAYRFDDPDGEVGIESHLLEAGGRLVHVPLTYRGEPLPGAQAWLVGTMEHSVLGTRWVYDAVGDPVYRAEVARVIREADTQVRLLVETPAGPVEREPAMRVRGSGVAGDGSTGGGSTGDGTAPGDLVVVRRPLEEADAPARGTLTGTWPGRDVPTVLVRLA